MFFFCKVLSLSFFSSTPLLPPLPSLPKNVVFKNKMTHLIPKCMWINLVSIYIKVIGTTNIGPRGTNSNNLGKAL